MAENRAIGAGNRLPWHLPEDFLWFKQQTTGKVLLMGRKTFASIGRPLPKRTTIVLSRTAAAIPGVTVIRSLAELPAAVAGSLQANPGSCPGSGPTSGRVCPAAEIGNPLGDRVPPGGTASSTAHERSNGTSLPEVWVCGGAEIYALTLPQWSEVFLTRVKRTVAGDAFFPAFEHRFPPPAVVRDTPEFTILHYRR